MFPRTARFREPVKRNPSWYRIWNALSHVTSSQSTWSSSELRRKRRISMKTSNKWSVWISTTRRTCLGSEEPLAEEPLEEPFSRSECSSDEGPKVSKRIKENNNKTYEQQITLKVEKLFNDLVSFLYLTEIRHFNTGV